MLCERGQLIMFLWSGFISDLCVFADALPAALQPPGEAASPEVVHAHVGA